MRGDRNKELKPGYQPIQHATVKGRRKHKVTSGTKKEAPAGDTYVLEVPKYGGKEVILPDTMMLTFEFENSNDKSWFVNNLGRQLQKRLFVLYGEKIIYENNGEAT